MKIDRTHNPEDAESLRQATLDTFPFYIMLIDADHKILLANKAVSKDFGLPPEQLIGGYCPSVIHGLDHPYPGCPLEEAVEKGQPVEREFHDPESGQWTRTAVYPASGLKEEGRPVFLHLAINITKQKQVENDIKRTYDIQAVTNAILHLSLEDISLEEILKRAVDLVLSIKWLALESRGGIFLVENESNILVMKAENNLDGPVKRACAQVPFGKCLCGRAALTQETIFADHIDERHEILYEDISPHGHYCVPILFAGKTLGVIVTYIKEGHTFAESEKDFLTAIANTLAGVIMRKRAEQELGQNYIRLQRALDATIQSMATASELRDPYTAGHQQRVTLLACAIAREMGLAEEKLAGLRAAGIVHDIGKLNIPSEILSKPGRLTEIEFNLIKTHSQAGYDILKPIDFGYPVANIVLEHHERMDGSGYPSGLKGGEILLESRILSIADVVEAITSDRPYRPGFGIEKALKEITDNRGKLYDSHAVDACLKLFNEKDYKFS